MKTSIKSRHIHDDRIEELEQQHAVARASCNEWEHHIHEDFNGYGCIAILNFHAYHLNIARGFGKSNSESNYQYHLSKDKDGKWLEAAMHWTTLSLASHEIHKEILKLQAERGDFTRRMRKKSSHQS
jgi:hypothetical protein